VLAHVAHFEPHSTTIESGKQYLAVSLRCVGVSGCCADVEHEFDGWRSILGVSRGTRMWASVRSLHHGREYLETLVAVAASLGGRTAHPCAGAGRSSRRPAAVKTVRPGSILALPVPTRERHCSDEGPTATQQADDEQDKRDNE
jgi:hypothetical protein